MAAAIELKLLKLMCKKEFYNSNFTAISAKVLSTEIKSLLKVIEKLHKLSDKDVCISDIADMYENSTTITTAKLNLVKQIVANIQALPDMSPDVALSIIEKLAEKEAARKIGEMALAIMQRNEGAGTLAELQHFVAGISIQTEAAQESDEYTTDINKIIRDKESKGVFSFKNGLEFLNEAIGKLSRGHLSIIFAPTNAGKSSFAAQATGGFLLDGYKVLYFANEEPAYHIVLNQIRALESRSDTDIVANPHTPIWDRVRKNFVIIPAHGKTLPELIKYIDKHKPDVIIFDQLDNVQGANVRDKLHETLERTYQQARAIASTANALVIAISQASDDATGKVVLRSQMLANSRVGKAACADLIIGIGMRSVDDATRGITLCKNKITGMHKTFHCVLNNSIARYES